MKQTDLELYRWKWHNLTRPKYNKKKYLSSVGYWKEYGAFVSVLSRQSGKTSMLGIIINDILKEEENNEIIVIVPYIAMINNFCRVTKCRKDIIHYIGDFRNIMNGIKFENTHLIVDEFSSIDDLKLNRLLNNMWKSVTMASSLG